MSENTEGKKVITVKPDMRIFLKGSPGYTEIVGDGEQHFVRVSALLNMENDQPVIQVLTTVKSPATGRFEFDGEIRSYSEEGELEKQVSCQADIGEDLADLIEKYLTVTFELSPEVCRVLMEMVR